MDILKILEESGKDLYLTDLEFFETELATGGHYDAAYQSQCRKKIKQIRAWLNGTEEKSENNSKEEKKTDGVKAHSDGIFMKMRDLAPKGSEKVMPEMNQEQRIIQDITDIRKSDAYKVKFNKYLRDNLEIDSAFIDKYHSLFEDWEMDAILSIRFLSEEFLEKYFGALDHEKIAKYQLFSEGFFMKHFSELDADIVLRQGKNEWRIKENRSKQLDVFLRLKGVKI